MSSSPPLSIEITEADQLYINEQLEPLGGLFGEEIAFQGVVETNKDDKDMSLVQRIIVVSRYKTILIKKFKGSKSLKKTIFHYDLVEINEPQVGGPVSSQDSIEIKFKDQDSKSIQTLYVKAPDRKAETIFVKSIAYMTFNISRGFPSHLLLKINLPKNRYQPFQFNHELGSDGKGIAEQYIAHSHYYKTKATLDYLRHLETLYLTYYPELDISQIPGVNASSSLGFNLYTAILCLRHNTFIKSLKICKVPHINVVSSVGEMLLSNSSISELRLSNLLTEQSFAPLGVALSQNQNMALQVLDLSDNLMSYESINSLCDGLSHFKHSLVELNLSKCNIPPKGIYLLFQAFERNFSLSLTLERLKLSNNRFQDTGSSAFAAWLSKSRGHNQLRELSLSQCQLNFNIISAPLRVLEVERLDLSKNKINLGAARLLATEALESLGALKYLNLSSCALYSESIHIIMIALSKNKRLAPASLTLDISENSFAAKTANRLTPFLPDCSFLGGLDISGNRFNTRNLLDIFTSLSSININALNVGYNPINSTDDVFIGGVLDFINKHSSLSKLGIGTTRGYAHSLHPIIQCLYNNKSIVTLDITGNEMNDHGACLLADCLRVNKTIQKILVAGNKFTAVGWHSISSPLIYYRNTTITSLELPAAHVPVFTSDTNLQPLIPEKRDQLEKLFEQIRFHLALNRNKVPASSRFAYLPSADPPLYVKAAAKVPEHLDTLQTSTTTPTSKLTALSWNEDDSKYKDQSDRDEVDD
ncbi:leucine-rich repeat-containing protein [Cavenderia fasciculata]|uniref:Leucine-rich repeat-containing protein n=1 Tax=Cavenderia fasciculata TaxID=261658 RepID=F4PUT6_CACFS|nr:leucine-rich repeat-containing protein [Cavenderia fasciculata]EGG21105.1 leucine-rich repeat-containing protein [Cavenderia fasciculata]|eukprot:XP_004358955.1 leucine-rich repeat-containing protein [Cavenderia fasciculata]